MSRTSSLLQTTSSSFKDSRDCIVVFRGTNLSGSSKLPAGRASQESYHFYEQGETGDLTYVGRPFLLWNRDLREDEQSEERRWYTSKWEDSADCHLARLRGWGFNVLRYLVTWEALEHDGPGKYDYEFIDFTIAILRKCKQYGFKVYIDPHQDVWSRFSGGSGAPYWTLIACGLNPRNFTQTGTAILHHEYIPPSSDRDPESNPRPDPAQLPAMLWSTGYNRFAAQTLFTLFFGGKTYAPKCIIDGVNIQDYLQSHYIEAFGLLVDKIHEADAQVPPEARLLDECIIGWDSINEPFAGFCAMDRIDGNSTTAHGAALKKGPQPTVMHNFCLGMGIKQSDIPNWDFGSFGPKHIGEIEIDPRGVKMWVTPEDAGEDENGVSARWGWRREASWILGTCIWALHGVWSFSDSTPEILNPTYFAPPPASSFSSASGSPFLVNFWLPHFKRYATRIRSPKSHPNAILFIQPPVFEPPPEIDESILQGRACLSTHYYDGLTLVTRHWSWFNADALGMIRGKYRWAWQGVKIGTRAIRASFQDQLSILKADARLISPFNAYPTMIGEIGSPMDMDHKKSYGLPYADPSDGDKYKGDFSEQVKALDASLNALDGSNALSATIWNYAVGNGHRWGDEWNLEDLSLWSQDDVVDLAEGVQRLPEVKGEVDMVDSQANLLNDKIHTRTAITSPLQADISRQCDEESSQTLDPLPPKGRFLHVDIGSAVTSTSSKAESPTAASPMSSSDTSPPYSPTSVTPPNPFATAANNTSTSLPLVRKDMQLKELELRIPLSLQQMSRSFPASPHSETRSSKVTRQPNQLQQADFKRQQTIYTASCLAFLRSGARALKAFARPYPITTMGQPVNVSFDVESGEFKMGVLVPVLLGLEHGSDIEGPSTEIFVPIVHYASMEAERMAAMTQIDTVRATRQHHPTSPYLSQTHSNIRTRTSMIDDDDSAPPTPQSLSMHPKLNSVYAAASASSMTLANILNKSFSTFPFVTTSTPPDYAGIANHDIPTDFDMDLEIQVSHGRTVLEGQVLKWYYDVPTERATGGHVSTVLYEICVRKGVNKTGDDGGEEVGERDGDRTCTRVCWEALERCKRNFVGV